MTEVGFEGRVAIITGAGGGLGRTYALEIARRGGAVVVNDLGSDVAGKNSGSASMADAVVAEIQGEGGQAIANYDSVATTEGAEAITDAAIAAFGQVDVLINNAGNLRNAPFEDLTVEDRDALWAVHLAGAFNATQPAYRAMKKQGYGRIVLTSSPAGLFGNADQSAYAAAKSGLLGLMTAITVEGAEYGIGCNMLSPTAASRMGGKIDPEKMAAMMELIGPFSTAMTPEFVTPMVVYLASEACSARGEIFAATGGRFARIFVGLADGWMGPRDTPATVEQIAKNIGKISDTESFVIPKHLVDEFTRLSANIKSG